MRKFGTLHRYNNSIHGKCETLLTFSGGLHEKFGTLHRYNNSIYGKFVSLLSLIRSLKSVKYEFTPIFLYVYIIKFGNFTAH